MNVDVLIVGGGLSGLHTAYELHKRGISFMLLEARDRFGGRILSYNADTQQNNSEYDAQLAAIDLGPSWFWPGQSRILDLINELGLSDDVFMQAGEGGALYEDNQGNVQRGITGVSMGGAYRMQGGIRKIISTLWQDLPSESCINNAVVTEIESKQESTVSKVLIDGVLTEVNSKHVVLALPPRVALEAIKFTPQFTDSRLEELNAVATWMAGHAKFVGVYENCFWNEAGFSGDVISHRGPLQEIHDASSKNGELSALFGFIGIPAQYRNQREDEIRSLAIAQLTRLFGEPASKPLQVHIKDWAFDKHTSTNHDQEMQTSHPANDIISVVEISWDQKLIWSGSETSDYRNHNNGFLEGALEASLRTVSYLVS